MASLWWNPFAFPVEIVSVFLAFFFFFSIKWFFPPRNIAKRPPPSPPQLPFIGNAHQLVGKFPPRTLATLAKRYGPLMYVRIGKMPTLVVSTVDAAREVLKTHDLDFSNRGTFSVIANEVTYEDLGVIFAPYGDYWRQLRSILITHLLSNTKLPSLRVLLEEETALAVAKILEASPVVDLSKLFMEFLVDILCRSMFGKKYTGEEIGDRFILNLRNYLVLFSTFDGSEFSSWLRWIHFITGKQPKGEEVGRELDRFFEEVVEEHLHVLETKSFPNNNNNNKNNDGDLLVYAALKIYRDNNPNVPIDRGTLKAFFMDILAAGTDATSMILEWTMLELLKNPTAMNKVQKEVRGILNGKEEISDDDIAKMHYLKAVMKEIFRLHPSNPFLIPRAAKNDINVGGYDIAAGTAVFVNIWGMGRDPDLWDQPEEFQPERFLKSSIDFTGKDFRLIPFGTGRRICPGMSLAMAGMQLLLATLLSKFDWKLPSGVKMEDLDATMSDRHPLHAIAIPLSS